ncbi:hypothetical protein [Sphingobacterium lactis]|uniref:Uncharacterized protein n=1 Tax=Sphingobacterium lactis TaxID=797291 RepID=A0A1H6CT78_9SPHI|nr:hypothetical protein [Sphingobacterium lactis]SEG75795.1 hypothetical protein SAMN05421877_11945 [Sphingobacterium lactis]
MSFVATIEADINKWTPNLDKAGKDVNNFASKVSGNLKNVSNLFEKINGTSIGGLQNRLAQLKLNLENATDIQSISKYNIRIRNTQDEIERLKNLGLQTSNSLKNIGSSSVTKGIDQYSRSLRGSNTVAMEFNRIIQDAPFGMMGISNNLTQLTDNYKTYAQSVRQAALEQGKSISNFQIFKGAVAGILSPINLFSLGISAVTSGLILYQQWQQRAKKATKETSDKFKELAENLNNISATMYKAAQSSGNEVAQLNALYKITTNVNQSTTARKKAAKELIDQYPALFGKFSQEQVMLGRAKTAYDEVSKSIIATARAQAAYGRIGEKASQQLAIDETNRSLQKEISLLDVAIKRQESLTTAGQSVGAAAEAVESGNVRKLNDLYEQRSNILNQVTGNLLDRAKIQEDINQLEGFAVTNQAKTIATTEKAEKKTKDYTDSIAKLMAELNGGALSEYDRRIYEINIKYEGIFETIKKIGTTSRQQDAFGLATQAKRFEILRAQAERFVETTANLKAINVGGLSNPDVNIPITLNPTLANGAYEKVTSDLELGTESLVDRVNSVLSSGISNGLTGMFNNIGEAMATGGNVMQAIGDSLVSGLSNLAKQIGEQMIAFGVAGIALKKLAMNPFLAIAAGAALVALGSFASSSVGRQTANFNGTNTSSYGSSVNTSSGAFPRGAYYNNDKQEVEFKIRGNDLVGAMKTNNNRNKRLG